MSFTTIFQDRTNQTSIKRKGTLRGLKAKKIQKTWSRRQDPSLKIPPGANICDVGAHRSVPILTAVFVAQVAQAVEVVVECATVDVVAPVSARRQRQVAITIDCLEGRRPETPYDWDAMEFVEDMKDMEADMEAGPLSRNSFFASYASRLKTFVDQLQ